MTPGAQEDTSPEAGDSPLNVAPAIVSHVIARAREAYADMPPADDLDIDQSEEWDNEAELSQLAEYIDALGEDEQIDLVVLMWIGRGTYTLEELEQARADAKDEATQASSDYLLSTPLVGDYLADGLEACGLSMEES